MAEATTAESAEGAADPGCGCCQPEPKSAADVVRELEARRDDLDRRLRRLDLVSAR